MKKLVPIIIIVLIVVVLIVLTKTQPENEVVITDTGEQIVTGVIEGDIETGILIGDQAPNFALESFTGEVIKLSDIGKPVVIDFWAGWCPFCVEEIPHLEAAHQEFGENIVFMGIHRSETESVAKGQEFADELGATYLLLKDSTGDVYNAYSGGQRFMPLAYYLDENGVIVERVIGPKTEDKISGGVDKLLQ